MALREEITGAMYADVWTLLYDSVDPQERARIDDWIDDFLERNPYIGGPVDKYFRTAASYFKQVIPDKRKIGSITMGLQEIAKSLHSDDFVSDTFEHKPEETPDSVGNKMDSIIDRLEGTLHKKDKKF
jgi:hypothetical protein